MQTALIGLVLTLFVGVQTPAPAKADPRENLDTAIAEAIRLLEKKDYAGFLTTFSEPGRLAKRRDSLQEFAAEFGRERAGMVLGVLKQIQKTKPSVSENGTVATFKVDPAPAGGRDNIRWRKTDRYWYIDN